MTPREISAYHQLRRSIFAEEQQLFEANDRHGQYLGV